MEILVGAVPSAASARPSPGPWRFCRVAIKGAASFMRVSQDSFQGAGGIWITTRRAAALRSSRNGRIGFKPPYSKGEMPPYAALIYSILQIP